MPPPPGYFGKAFAFYEPGGGGEPGAGPRFILSDPTDGRWKDGDRYAFMSIALFSVADRASGSSNGSRAMFYPEPDSNRLFFTFYEPKSKRVYCFEGDPQQAASIVPIPLGDTKGDQNLRAQIVKVILLNLRLKT